MKNTLIYLIILFFTLGIANAKNERTPLTLSQCLLKAEEYSDALKIQQEKNIQTKEVYKQSRGNALPKIDYKYTKYYKDTVDSYVTANQPLFYGLRLKNAIAYSQYTIKKDEFRYYELKRTLHADVSEVFFAVLQIEKDIDNINITINLMQERAQELSKRIRLGKSRQSEILVFESQIATLKAQQEKNYGDHAQSIEILSRLTGIDSSEIVIIDDSQSVLDESAPIETYTTLISKRPDIEGALASVTAQEYAVRIAKGSIMPSVDFDGSWYTNDYISSMSEHDWDVSLSLGMPLFRGGAAISRIREQVSIKKELEYETGLLKRDALLEVKTKYRRLVSSLNQAKAYKEAYDKAEKSYHLQLNDYRLGLVNNLDVIQSMTIMSDSKRNFDRTLIQIKNDKTQLEIAVANK